MNANDTPLFTIRPLAKEDVPFVYNSMLKSYRDSPTVAGIPNTIYYAEHHRIIEGILADPQSRVHVACNSEDPAQIYGYAIGRTAPGLAIIDWIYVKHPFRSFGIARALEKEAIGANTVVHYTHRVKHVERLLKNRNYIYNPYLLFEVAA